MQNLKSWSQKTWVIVLAGLLAPPIGMVLAWLKPEWPTRTKWLATGLMAFVLFTMYRSSVVSAEFAAAEQLWSDGKVSEAVEIYRDILGSPALDREENERAFQRVIEFDCANNEIESAKTLIKRAVNNELSVTLSEPTALALYDQEQTARRERTGTPIARKSKTLAPDNIEKHIPKNPKLHEGYRAGWEAGVAAADSFLAEIEEHAGNEDIQETIKNNREWRERYLNYANGLRQANNRASQLLLRKTDQEMSSGTLLSEEEWQQIRYTLGWADGELDGFISSVPYQTVY